MDEESSRVSFEAPGSAPASDSAAVGSRPATPWWTGIVGVALGVVSGFAAAWGLRPDGDGFAIFSVLALITVPAVVAFLVTAGLARAALRPAGTNRDWLASESGLLLLVIIMGAVLGLGVYAFVSYIEDSALKASYLSPRNWLF